MKTLQYKLNERADKALKERISKSTQSFTSIWGNCMEIDYAIRQKGCAQIEEMHKALFDGMCQKNREKETASFLASVESLKEQLDSMQLP